MKRKPRPIMIVPAVTILLVMHISHLAFAAAGPKVSEIGNKHNLSAIGRQVGSRSYTPNINTYQATNDPINNPRGQQICIFCHTPHNANIAGQAPLWNRKFSSESFQRYSTSTLQIRKITEAQYAAGAQPSGSSKLCLSCHDGVSKLGDVYSGAPITMLNDVITGVASFNPNTNKMKSGHHPVSFVYNEAVRGSIQASRVPATVFTLPGLTQVKLDKESRMQCTTCHDAHQNQSNDTDCYGGTCNGTNTRKIAPFWVYGVNNNGSADQQAVCITCHPMTLLDPGFVTPWPTP